MALFPMETWLLDWGTGMGVRMEGQSSLHPVGEFQCYRRPGQQMWMKALVTSPGREMLNLVFAWLRY